MKALLTVLIVFCISLAWSQHVNNLRYTYTDTSYNRKNEQVIKKHFYNFRLNQGVLLAEKLNVEGVPYRPHIFDKKSNIVAITQTYRNGYQFDEIDSLFAPSGKVFSTGETQIIEGYNCTKYKIKDAEEYYSIWITSNLIQDDYYDPYILWLITRGAARDSVKGTVVRIDQKYVQGKKIWNMSIALDVSQIKVRNPEIILPWNNPEAGDALFVMECSPNYVAYRKGDKSVKRQNERLMALLLKANNGILPKNRKECLTQDYCLW